MSVAEEEEEEEEEKASMRATPCAFPGALLRPRERSRVKMVTARVYINRFVTSSGRFAELFAISRESKCIYRKSCLLNFESRVDYRQV